MHHVTAEASHGSNSTILPLPAQRDARKRSSPSRRQQRIRKELHPRVHDRGKSQACPAYRLAKEREHTGTQQRSGAREHPGRITGTRINNRATAPKCTHRT